MQPLQQRVRQLEAELRAERQEVKNLREAVVRSVTESRSAFEVYLDIHNREMAVLRLIRDTRLAAERPGP